MIKKHMYLFIALILVILTPITTYKHDTETSITALNTQQNQYVGFIEEFLTDIHEVQVENPINQGSFKSQGEIYTYNALSEREKLLSKYTYTDDIVPAEYLDFHHDMVEFVTLYKEGINIAKEGVLVMRADIINNGLAKIISANDLLVKLQENFILMQSPSSN